MLRRFSFWMYTAIVFQVLTAIAHSLSFVVKNEPENDTEKQLQSLMNSYNRDLGAGFHPTLNDIFIALSATFILLYMLGALSNWFLIKKKVSYTILKGILNINLIIFGICFIIMAFFTFLPPIVMTGLTFIFLLAAKITLPKE